MKNSSTQHSRWHNNKVKVINTKQVTRVNTQNLPVLDTNRYTEWCDALENHFLAESPDYGDFISTKERANVDVITDPEHWDKVTAIMGINATDKVVQKLKCEEITRYTKEIAVRDRFYKSAFHTIMKTIAETQVEILKIDAKWEEAKTKSDPIMLMEIIRKRLIYGIAGMNDEEAEDAILGKFDDPQQFNQKQYEDVHQYVKRSKELFTTLTAMKCPRVGTKRDCIRKIVKGLDSARYSEYKRHVAVNALKNDPMSYPDSFANISAEAEAHMDTYRPKRSNQIFAYNANGEQEEDEHRTRQKKNDLKCSYCGKNGHEEEKCWAKNPEMIPRKLKRKVELSGKQDTIKKRKIKIADDPDVDGEQE